MAFVNIFCFWFSVRLGSIIIACVTLLQSIVWIVFASIFMDNLNDDQKDLNEFLNQFSLTEEMLQDIIRDSEIYLITFTVFLATLMFTCILLIIGSFKCKPELMIPFIVTYFIYVSVITFGHIVLMMNFKKEDYGIGVLILYSNAGGFLILYLLYLWVCVVSFVQIIYELRLEIKRRHLVPGIQQFNNGVNMENSKLKKAYIR